MSSIVIWMAIYLKSMRVVHCAHNLGFTVTNSNVTIVGKKSGLSNKYIRGAYKKKIKSILKSF